MEPSAHAGRAWDALWLYARLAVAELPTSMVGAQPCALVAVEAISSRGTPAEYWTWTVSRHNDRDELERSLARALANAPQWATRVRVSIGWYGLVRDGKPRRLVGGRSWTTDTVAFPAERSVRLRLAREACREIASRLGRKQRRSLAAELESLAALLLRHEGLPLGEVAARLYDLGGPAVKTSNEWRMAVRALRRARGYIDSVG